MTKKINLPIETQRLIITEFHNNDAVDLYQIATNINLQSDLHKDEGYLPFYTFQVDRQTEDREKKIREKTSQFIIKSHNEKKQEPRNTYRLAVRLKENNQLIGNVTTDMIPSFDNGKEVFGDLGYFLDPKYEKKGYATEAVSAVCKLFFKEFERMDITAHPDNLHSRKLLEKLGGQKVGHKDTSGYGNGEPRDIFEIHKKDFYQKSPFAKDMNWLTFVLVNKENKK